ncbi:MAG: hypothetical protein PUA62_08255 [Lachnospiraceae bacterium]|nr:hypothetical protein [Lachnospiraceae bacterium]
MVSVSKSIAREGGKVNAGKQMEPGENNIKKSGVGWNSMISFGQEWMYQTGGGFIYE